MKKNYFFKLFVVIAIMAMAIPILAGCTTGGASADGGATTPTPTESTTDNSVVDEIATAAAQAQQQISNAAATAAAQIAAAGQNAAPTQQPAQTPTPTAAPTQAPQSTQVPATSSSSTDFSTFTYIPGGPNYAWPNGGVENLADGWTRIRQDANGEFNAWTALVRIKCNQPLDKQLQWDSSEKLEVFGGSSGIQCRIEIKRDTEWAQDLQKEHPGQALPDDPYTVANAKDSPLGLGWFITGTGTVVVNGDSSVKLDGPGVKQMNFPHDMTGEYVIDLTVPSNGLVVLNQGERITDQDNWATPN
jgi:hypothetical protein